MIIEEFIFCSIVWDMFIHLFFICWFFFSLNFDLVHLYAYGIDWMNQCSPPFRRFSLLRFGIFWQARDIHLIIMSIRCTPTVQFTQRMCNLEFNFRWFEPQPWFTQRYTNSYRVNKNNKSIFSAQPFPMAINYYAKSLYDSISVVLFWSPKNNKTQMKQKITENSTAKCENAKHRFVGLMNRYARAHNH